MARRKSINDIRAQRDRIVEQSRAAGRESRAQRAEQIAWRYQENLMRTPSQQRVTNTAQGQQLRDAAATILRGNKIKYSRATYMGLNEG